MAVSTEAPCITSHLNSMFSPQYSYFPAALLAVASQEHTVRVKRCIMNPFSNLFKLAVRLATSLTSYKGQSRHGATLAFFFLFFLKSPPALEGNSSLPASC